MSIAVLILDVLSASLVVKVFDTILAEGKNPPFLALLGEIN